MTDPTLIEQVARPDKAEFCARFKARMLACTAPIAEFTDGGSIADYADEAAPAYFDDSALSDHSPEECADIDISYWED